MGLRFDRYETLEPIAAGGMAKVYRGRAIADGGFERIVAIKVMHSHLASDPEFVDMFLDEARLAAKIRHPNVVPTHDVRQTPVGTFLVMEYVDGYDFAMLQRALRSKKRRVPIEITLRIVIDALHGLAAAHQLREPDGTHLKLVHRDVSPQNILLDRATGTVQLTDFGVAHAAERLSSTQAGALKGKLGYLSPEHARDGAVDSRSDIYSAGVLLWEALASEPMFAGRARVRVLGDILKGNLRSPRHVNPAVPQEISDVCMCALSLAPEERYQTAEAFVEALESAAAAASITIARRTDIRDFLSASSVAEYAKATALRLNEDEQTLIERPQVLSASQSEPKSEPSRKWWYAAAGLALLAAAALYPLFGLGPELRSETPLAVPIEEPSLILEQVPVLDTERLARFLQSPSSNADAESAEQKATPSRRGNMYHPNGL